MVGYLKLVKTLYFTTRILKLKYSNIYTGSYFHYLILMNNLLIQKLHHVDSVKNTRKNRGNSASCGLAGDEAGGETKEMDPSMLTMNLSLLCQDQF